MKSKCYLSIIALLVIIHIYKVNGKPTPLTADPKSKSVTEYGYFKLRDDLIEMEKVFEGRNFNLSNEEKVVDAYLGYLKWEEMLQAKQNGFLPSLPIEKVLGNITRSKVYEILKKLPKGGNLHSHEDHQLSKRKLFEIIWASDDFKQLYIIDPENNKTKRKWEMDFFINPPVNEPWIKVKDSKYTLEVVLKQNTLIGLLTEEDSNSPTKSDERWERINPLWVRASTQLIANVKIKDKYLEAILEHSLSEGVTYVEGRRSFGLDTPLYELDYSGKSNGTNGKKFIDPNSTKEVEIAMNVAAKFRAKNVDFIDYKRISYVVRVLDYETFDKIMKIAIGLHQSYPEHLIGFDAVAEEDQGYSSLHYIRQYLSLQKNGSKVIPLYLHTAETSWPDDLMSSSFEDDPVPTLQNSYESVLMQVRRVGHGKGYIKKPFLMNLMKKLKIAAEVCVVSNQILGMEPDLRNHFGQVLHKNGVPVILSPDDPGTFGYDNLTVDWYAAYTSWGLNLGDLKQFALNSLTHSGMDDKEKDIAINKKWLPSWNVYIKQVYEEACRRNLTEEAIKNNRKVTFGDLYPNKGNNLTKIHIYGRNFERAICKTPKCKIGDKIVNANYESNQHLTCVVPPCVKCPNVPQPVFVDLDGLGMVPTKFTFQYKEDETSFERNRSFQHQFTITNYYLLICLKILVLIIFE